MRHFVLTLLGLGICGPAAFAQMPVYYYYPYPQPAFYHPAQAYYYAPVPYYPVQPVYYSSPAPEPAAPPHVMALPTGENVAYGGVLTTDGVIPVRDYFTGLQRRSSYLQQLRERQAPGRVLPPVLPPKIDEQTAQAIAAEPDRPNPISVPVQSATPVAPPRGFLQRLFAPSLER